MAVQKPTIEAQITWVYTEDLHQSERFYRDVLGLECIRDEGRARIFRTVGDAAIGVCEAFEDRLVEPRGGMISLVTDDVDGWHQKLMQAGIEAESPHRLEKFGIYTCFAKDPSGYIIEFQQFD
jgi:catechol 2,3-dioxygenase-like lactoylglutathione lyase family enzyme